MSKEQPFWESNYKASDTANTFGQTSPEVVDLSKKLTAGSRILDIGCGDGRHALFLAKKGFDVTAIDLSTAGIKKLSQLAKRSGVSINTQVVDMRRFEFTSSYDVIIAHGCLHLIPRLDWSELLVSIKKHTNNLGFNIIVVFTNKLPPPKDLRPFHVGLFNEGELYDFYLDWEIIESRSYILEDVHPGGIRHRHPINKLVARRSS
jgi:tellurite methyltransferase